MSQYLHPKETAVLNHEKREKIKQDPIPEKKSHPGCLSLSTSFFYLFFLSS
jgi:hypothetical protein